MSSLFRKLIFLLLSCLLAACVTMPISHAPLNQKMSWAARKKQLNTVKSWHIQGAIAVQTAKKSSTAYINWQQNLNQFYTINIFGPFGLGGIVIQGQSGHVTLTTADQQKITAKTPEKLLEQALGWRLPISNLYNWIRGLPIQNFPAKIQFDPYHHIIQLTQKQWKIRYLQYTNVRGIDLPNKIEMIYPNLHIHIFISRW